MSLTLSLIGSAGENFNREAAMRVWFGIGVVMVLLGLGILVNVAAGGHCHYNVVTKTCREFAPKSFPPVP